MHYVGVSSVPRVSLMSFHVSNSTVSTLARLASSYFA